MEVDGFPIDGQGGFVDGLADKDKPAGKSRYIPWADLLKRTFEIDTACPRCKTPLRLIAMIETEDTPAFKKRLR